MLEDTIGEQSVVAEQDTIANNSKVQIKNFFPDGTFWAIETKESGEEYIIHANILGNVIKRLFSSEIGELEYGINDTLIIVRSKGEYDKFHVLDVQTNEDITNRYVGDYDEICKYIETEDKVVFVVKKIVKSFEEKYVCLQLVDEIGNKIFQTHLINQWTHQWCRVNINGTYWICDAYGLYVGPEPPPYVHPRL